MNTAESDTRRRNAPRPDEDRSRTTKRRATAAVVILAVGLVVAVAAPIVEGDRFLQRAVVSTIWAELTPCNGDRKSIYSFTDAGEPVEVASAHATRVSPTVMLLEDDLVGLLASDPRWIAATVALVAIPLWFLWWRRAAVGFGRGIGALASAAATAALVTLAWPATEFCAAHVLVAAPVAYLAAFLVAPPPADDVESVGRRRIAADGELPDLHDTRT